MALLAGLVLIVTGLAVLVIVSGAAATLGVALAGMLLCALGVALVTSYCVERW